MNSEEIIKLLKQVGFNSYEARCYIALIRYNILDAKDCAKYAKVPKTRVHEILRSLMERGLITIIDDKPRRYQIIDSKKSINAFVEEKENELENIRNNLLESLSTIKTYKKGDIITRTIITSGTKRQKQLTLDMNRTAKSEILIIGSGDFIPYNVLIEAKSAIKRGVKIKYIITKIRNQEQIKKIKQFGYNLRYTQATNLFIAIKDRKESLIIIRNPRNQEDRICILIDDKSLAKAHADYFYSKWKDAKKI